MLLDSDGILSDFAGAVVATVNREFGRSHTVDDVKEYAIDRALGLTPAEWRRVCDLIAGPRWAYQEIAEPTAEVKAAVAELQSFCDVRVLTAPWDSRFWPGDRTEWLADHLGIPHRDVIHAHSSEKAFHYGDLLVEDRLETLRAWKVRHPHAVALLVDQPHNRSEWQTKTVNVHVATSMAQVVLVARRVAARTVEFRGRP